MISCIEWKKEILMFGVDEFINKDHAKQCAENAEKNLDRVKKVFIPSVMVSAVSLSIWIINSPFLLRVIVVIPVLSTALCIYSGAYSYFGEFMCYPIRWIGGYAGLVLTYLGLVIDVLIVLFFPVILVWYTKYLSKITINSYHN